MYIFSNKFIWPLNRSLLCDSMLLMDVDEKIINMSNKNNIPPMYFSVSEV